jgi:hypothetical protein
VRRGERRPTCGGQAVTDAQRAELEADLRAMPEVDEVFYESQQDAYEHFQEQFADSPDLVENVTADVLRSRSASSSTTRRSSRSSPRPSSTGPASRRCRTRRRCSRASSAC